MVYCGSAEGYNTFYAFNQPDGGWVLVSADDSTAPILGYSPTGSFSMTEAPSNLRSWLKGYSREIVRSIHMGLTYSPMQSRSESDWAAIEPICKTEWAQTEPYNNLCPQISGRRAVAGCVATAMAQIAKVHNWPPQGVGTMTYSDNGTTRTLNLGEMTFDWDNMLDDYFYTDYTTEQATAVAQITQAMGYCAEMNYGVNESGATPADAATNMILHMQYDKGMRDIWRYVTPYEEWKEMLYAELTAGRPVNYNGDNSTAGHSFVCDGYDGNGYWHINWGWRGMSDGYFLLSVLNPEEQGTGSSEGGYNLNQEMIIGIQPAQDGSEYVYSAVWEGNFTPTSTGVRKNANSLVQFGREGNNTFWKNISLTTVKMSPGIKLTDSKGEATYLVSTYGNGIEVGYGQGYYFFSVQATSFPDGDYVVTPAYKVNDQWYDMPAGLSYINQVNVSVANNYITLSWDEKTTDFMVTDAVVSTVYGNQPAQVDVIFKATKETYTEVTPVLYKDGVIAAQASAIGISLLEGETASYTFFCSFYEVSRASSSSLEAGEYTLGFLNDGTTPVTIEDNKTIAVTVDEFEAGTPVIKSINFVDSPYQGTSQTRPATLPMVGGEVEMEITSVGGMYIEQLSMGIGQLLGTSWYFNYYLDPQYVVIGENETATITFRPTLTMLEENETYCFLAFKNDGNWLDSSQIRYFQVTDNVGIQTVGSDARLGLLYTAGDSYATILGLNGEASVAIYSINGRLMSASRINSSSAQVAVSQLPAGHYLIKVSDNEGTSTLRLMKR